MIMTNAEKIKHLFFIPTNKNIEPVRYQSIDIARGIAIFWMLVAHVYLLFPINIKYDYLEMLAAPFFLIIAGTVFNQLGSIVSKTPLTSNFLLVFINTVILVMTIIVTRRGSGEPPLKRKIERWVFPTLLSISLLVMGFIGVMAANFTGSNIGILILILTIAVSVPVILLRSPAIPGKILKVAR
jgi:peptidoglycan/LPS O-acetylase OafA/YrhL